MTTRLGTLLEEVAGVSSGALGAKNLTRAARERMSACGLVDEEQYFEKARSSAQEIQALIEAVVVSETWFFRDRAPFAFLGQHIRNEWIPARKARAIRILSAPCSSGEEPYSIAIVLQQAGMQAGTYRIDALDISRSLLRKAECAIYSQHSFRGVPASVRDFYFESVGRNYLLKDTARRRVSFMHGNLTDEHILAATRPYDIVFCRNLLIYCGAHARARVVRTLERLITRNGLLFVGHAEMSCFPAHRFAPLEDRGAFGFRKIELTEAAASPDARERRAIVPSTTPEECPPQRVSSPDQSCIHEDRISQSRNSLEAARKLADQGRLPDAATLCERLLIDDKANGEAYCLLGAIMHAVGDLGRAEECFSRAIYLDEACYDAIVQLSLIREHRGDLAGAEVLRRRAARIKPQARAW